MKLQSRLLASTVFVIVSLTSFGCKISSASDDVAVLETNYGRIVIEFLPQEAPKNVANFEELARDGFFDGTKFHRIVGKSVKHVRGIVSMARRQNDVNSATSQFFICVAPEPQWDGQYSIFGRVIDGM